MNIDTSKLSREQLEELLQDSLIKNEKIKILEQESQHWLEQVLEADKKVHAYFFGTFMFGCTSALLLAALWFILANSPK